jgi:hypothetical protein
MNFVTTFPRQKTIDSGLSAEHSSARTAVTGKYVLEL